MTMVVNKNKNYLKPSNCDRFMQITAVVQENSGFNVSRFDLKELLGHIDDVKLAVFQDMDVDCLVAKQVGKHFEMVEMPRDDVVLFHDKSIKIHSPPIPSGSDKSSAEYFVWDEDTGILFQRIPANKYTSCNYHTKGDERFYNIKGKSSICICRPSNNYFEGFKNLENGNSVFMSSGYCHGLYAPSGPSYNIILMPPGTGRSDHHYPDRCPKQYFLLPEKCISYVE